MGDNQATDNAQQAGTQPAVNVGQQAGTQPTPTQNVTVDYEKIASIVAGKQQVAEDTVLKNYFKQQGLSPEEANQAISAFKTEKAKNQPDVGALQSELVQYKQQAQKAAIEQQATLLAISSGLDTKSVPYVLKMADFSDAADATGTINAENIQKAINKVLEDVPALKPASADTSGFKVGSAGTQEHGNGQTQEEMLKGIFGIK